MTEGKLQVPCIESGVELLARLSGRDRFPGLEDALFQEKLRPRDVIEITGETGTGKTLLLSQMIGKCLIPAEGAAAGASVILINTDHHFEVSKLTELMIDMIHERHRESNASEDFQSMKDAALSYLHNLIVLQCYNVDQFLLTLHTLDNVLLCNRNTALLALDSMTAYYWEDRERNGLASVDSYVNRTLRILRAYTNQFNIVTVYTRTRNKNAIVNSLKFPESFCEKLDYRVLLCRTDSADEFFCVVKDREGKHRELGYRVLKNGIRWD